MRVDSRIVVPRNLISTAVEVGEEKPVFGSRRSPEHLSGYSRVPRLRTLFTRRIKSFSRSGACVSALPFNDLLLDDVIKCTSRFDVARVAGAIPSPRRPDLPGNLLR